ncbi:hypothetical protein KCTC52924_02751 [Arenibacter antarcticus]
MLIKKVTSELIIILGFTTSKLQRKFNLKLKEYYIIKKGRKILIKIWNFL